MILCDHEIESAIKSGEIIVEPQPQSSQFNPTALDLRVGSDFRRWKQALSASGLDPGIKLGELKLIELLDFTEPVEVISGYVEIRPNDFILVRTLERIHLPTSSKLAARIEGRSTPARLGMSVHVTAPTIHGGFNGKITLEIINHGPFIIKIKPEIDCISQLIFEKVSAQPERGSTTFMQQSTPLGTPVHKR
jgi:dCTP deaminase